MSHRTLSSLVFIFLIVSQVASLQEDYYWREYTGTIPADAVVGGKDINGSEVYIGKVYDKNTGLIPVQIYPGVKEVVVPIWGKVKNVDSYIQILCGPQNNFYWMPANYKDLHLTLIDKHPIIGGHIDGGGQINIGRIHHEGETKIGRILSYDIGRAFFYFHDHGKEGANVENYEILMYKISTVDVGVNTQ